MDASEFKLVVTSAFREELPLGYLRESGVPLLSLQAALAGDLRNLRNAKKGILFFITGPGRDNSLRAIRWIKENLNPLFVLNIGGAAVADESMRIRQWYIPRIVYSQEGQGIPIHQNLPLPLRRTVPQKAPSLFSSLRPVKGPFSKKGSLIDMEAYWQAMELQDSGISFHCLKFSTDRPGPDSTVQYRASLEYLRRAVKDLFAFVKTKRPSFTVVIPTKDRAERLKNALDSVISQSFPPERIIVVDDGSRDRTKRLLEAYKGSVKGVFLMGNYGVSRARGIGALMAETEWLAFLDSDDLWTVDKLLLQREFIERYPFFEILQSEEIWIRNGRRVNPCKYHRKPEGWAWPHVLRRCLISPSGVVLKKDLLDRYGGFREDFPVCEDYDLWLRITREHPVGLVRTPGVVKFGGHEDQLSRAYPAMDRFRLKSLLEAYLREEEEPFKRQLEEVILEKANILLQGAMKRVLKNDVRYYKTVIRVIEKHFQKDKGLALQTTH